jgi:hypothetical protein
MGVEWRHEGPPRPTVPDERPRRPRRMTATDTATETNPAQAEKTASATGTIVWAAVLVLVAIYCLEFGLQSLLWIESHHWAGIDPELAEIPQPLPAPASPPSAESKGTVLRAYDYQFQVPWTGKYKQSEPKATTEFRFDSGQIVILIDPEAQLDVLRGIRTSKSQEYLNFATVLENQNVDSNYGLFGIVYGASPAQVSPLMPQSDAQRMNVLLLWKLSFGADARPGIYSFDFGKNRGFQFGSPAPDHSADRLVALRVFDDLGQQLRMVFTTVAGSGAKITQDDIDLAAQSLKSIPMVER